MTRSIFVAILMGLMLSLSATSSMAYDRNQAVPVQKVEYGSIESVRTVTKEELVRDRNSGWKTFGGALLGGIIGAQFGGGYGQDVATVLGAIAGGSIANRSNPSHYKVRHKLVELMVKQDSGQSIMIMQDYDPGMVFKAGDEVRVVYLTGYVRVDKAM